MKKQEWTAFAQRYPDIAERVLSLGTTIYERGAERSRGSHEIRELIDTLSTAPEEARNALGFAPGEKIEEREILTAIFEHGSSLLLDYVQNGH